MLTKRKIYYNTGEVLSIYYVDNDRVMQGVRTAFYRNGNIAKEFQYVNGVVNGKCTEYHYNNSSIKEIYFISNDETIGENVQYNDQGIITRHTWWDSDGEVNISQYVQDVYNLTPEEEVLLALMFGENVIYPRPERICYAC